MKSSQQKKLLEIRKQIRERYNAAERPPNAEACLPGGPPIRSLRRGLQIWKWNEQIRFRVPLRIKNALRRLVRRLSTSEAELGLFITQRLMDDPAWIAGAVRDFRRKKRRESKGVANERPQEFDKAA